MDQTTPPHWASTFSAWINSRGLGTLIANHDTKLSTVEIDGQFVPVSRNEGREPAGYLCSPSTAFIDYGREELARMVGSGPTRALGEAVLKGFAPLIRAAKLDRQVQLNNALVATNILPPCSPDALLDAMADLAQANPGFAVTFRSANWLCHGPLLQKALARNLVLLPMRKVFVRDYGAGKIGLTTDEAKDLRLLNRPDLRRKQDCNFSVSDFERAAALYGQLYLKKYSRLNPQYTALYLAQARANLGLRLEGLFLPDSGTMVGVIGRLEQYGWLTGPIVGYDLSQPRRLGLYRRLRAINHAHARDKGMVYGMSAGAETFKLNRGGTPTLEVMLVDPSAMNQGARLALRTLSATLNSALPLWFKDPNRPPQRLS